MFHFLFQEFGLLGRIRVDLRLVFNSGSSFLARFLGRILVRSSSFNWTTGLASVHGFVFEENRLTGGAKLRYSEAIQTKKEQLLLRNEAIAGPFRLNG